MVCRQTKAGIEKGAGHSREREGERKRERQRGEREREKGQPLKSLILTDTYVSLTQSAARYLPRHQI